MNYKDQLKGQRSKIENICSMKFHSIEEARRACDALWKQIVPDDSSPVAQLLGKANILTLNIAEDSDRQDKPSFIHRLRNVFKWEPVQVEYRLNDFNIVWKQCEEAVAFAEGSTQPDNDAESLKEEIESLKKALDAAKSEKEELEDKIQNLKVEKTEQPSKHKNDNPADEPQVPLTRFERFVASYQRILSHAIYMKDKDEARLLRKDVIMLLSSEGYDIVDYDGKNDDLFEIKTGNGNDQTEEVYPAIISEGTDSIVKKGLIYKPAKH